MPRAPTYNPATQGIPSVEARFRAPSGPSGGQMIAEAGQRLAQSVGQFAQAQDNLNAQFDDTQARKLALQARTAAATVTSEFSALQGGNAVSARVDTEGRLQKIREEALGSVTNPRMRALFEQYYDAGHAEALQAIGSHTIRQAQAERVGVLSSEIESFSDLAINNPDKSDERLKAIEAGKASIAQLGQMKGMGEAEVALSQKKFVSGVHANTIDKLLVSAEPDIDMAAAYFSAHADEMTSADRERAMKDLQGPLQDRSDYAAYTEVNAGMVSAGAPPMGVGKGDLSRMAAITAETESGNRDHNADGSFVTSVKGAQGRMQVMPGTQRDPGFGVKPAANNSAAELARVGRDYLAAMMTRYGNDPAKAWAAYNAGPGAVDEALKDGGNWLARMPKETRDYVKKNVAALGGTDNAPREYDKAAIYDAIEARTDWTYEKKERVKRVADREIARDEQLLQRQYKAAGDEAVQAVIGLGDNFTDISQIPAATRAKMDPTDLMRLTETAAKNKAAKAAIPNDTTRSLELQALMRMDPEAFARIDLSKEVGRVSHDDLKDLFLKRADIIGDKNKPAKDKKRTIITAAIEWGKKYGGIDISDKDFPKVFDAMSAYLETVEAKKGVLDASDGDAAFKGATRDIPKAGFFGGTMKAYNVTSVDQIPDVTRADIDRTFRAANRRDPNDMERLQMYRSMLVNAGAR